MKRALPVLALLVFGTMCSAEAPYVNPVLGDVRLRRLAAGAGEDSPALMEVRGEFLQALSNSEILRSHLPVTVRQGGTTLNAQNFEYRHLTGQATFSGRTTGVINARPGK